MDIFSSIVSYFMDNIYCNILESQTLAALRDALLPKLISGELRVKDVEKILEDAV
jgi:type I restriction enzyme S subunit